MNLFKKIVTSTFLFSITGSVYAIPTTIDFKADADALERGYLSLDSYAGLTITASGPDDPNADGSIDLNQYAYMDSRSGANVANGGLGACMDVTSSYQCAPSSDDNVTFGESVHMVWDNDILITGLWFNNNHDGNRSLEGNTISIEGDDYLFNAADFDASRSSGDGTLSNAVSLRNADFLYGVSRAVSAGDSFDISFFDDQFYVSAIQYETVPEPGVLALMSLGLIGMITVRRRM